MESLGLAFLHSHFEWTVWLPPEREGRFGSCVTSIAGPHGDMQLYER